MRKIEEDKALVEASIIYPKNMDPDVMPDVEIYFLSEIYPEPSDSEREDRKC